MSAEIRTGRLGLRLLLSGSIKNGDSPAGLCRPAGDRPNGHRHLGGPDHHLSTGTAWLPDSQANSPWVSETRRHVISTVCRGWWGWGTYGSLLVSVLGKEVSGSFVRLALGGASLEMKGAHSYTRKRPLLRNATVSIRGAHNTDTATCIHEHTNTQPCTLAPRASVRPGEGCAWLLEEPLSGFPSYKPGNSSGKSLDVHPALNRAQKQLRKGGHLAPAGAGRGNIVGEGCDGTCRNSEQH